jgi:uncharacterized protein (DUF427 family)
MAVRYSDSFERGLRFEPTPKRIRTEWRGQTVVDTTDALLIWEAEQTVPKYAVPRSDIDPGVAAQLPDGAVRDFDDPDLAGYWLLDWDAFDRWLEEEEEVIGHPRDPFHRVDIRRSSRHVRVELDGELLAESASPMLVFETGLPVRYYFDASDVATARLEPSSKATTCAYKGQASYWSVRVGDRVAPDLAWSYVAPLPDNAQLRGLIAFFNERADITVDGELQERPQTQWSEVE